MSREKQGWGLKVRVWVEREGKKVLGPGRVELLEHIDRLRSISAAAKQMNMSYRRAWELVRSMNDTAGVPLVEANVGGPGGGGASVTEHGHRAIQLYRDLVAQLTRSAEAVGLPEEPLAVAPHAE